MSNNTYVKRIGIFLFPLIQVFFSVRVGSELHQSGKLSLLGSIPLFCCYLFVHYFFLDTVQKNIAKGKMVPLPVYAVKVIMAFLLWFAMGNYRITAYFLLFFFIEFYQVCLLLPKIHLGQDWMHVIIESFFAGVLFPLLVALTLPFKLDASYLWQFVPAGLFIYLVTGLAQNRSIRPEKHNTSGLSLWCVACLVVVLQGISKGLIQGVALFLLIAVYFVLYKQFRYSNYKQYSLSVLLLLGTLLLY